LKGKQSLPDIYEFFDKNYIINAPYLLRIYFKGVAKIVSKALFVIARRVLPDEAISPTKKEIATSG